MADAAKTEHPDVPAPVVRHFIACERIDTESLKGQYSLLGVVHAIRALPGAAFPRIHPLICLFVQMTDGRGSHSFQAQVVFGDDEESTFTSKAVMLDLGDDPLIVHGWPIRLRNILFERPGLYELRLLCDGKEIAREPIVLREAP